MIKNVIDFCAYGTMLEDYYGVKKRELFTKDEEEILSAVIEKEIERYTKEEMLVLYKKKFRESINSIFEESN